jgi:hypothetical protein
VSDFRLREKTNVAQRKRRDGVAPHRKPPQGNRPARFVNLLGICSRKLQSRDIFSQFPSFKAVLG